MGDNTRRFSKLFRGRDTCIGQHTPSTKKTTTERRGPTPGDFERHLAGKSPGIGVAPIRKDNTCYFGAIDLDGDQDASALATTVGTLKLPLVVTSSKSGGAHLWLFMKEPVPAVEVVKALKSICRRLGLTTKDKETGEEKGEPEIFPKQTRLPADEAIGSWINLPYFGVTRVAYNDKGDPLENVEQFLSLAEERGISRARVAAVGKKSADAAAGGEGQPGSSSDYDKAGRNSWLFRWGVKLAEEHPDDWEVKIWEYNAVNPHGDDLPKDEVEAVIKSVKRHLEKFTPAARERTDVGNGERFADQHIKNAKYCASIAMEGWFVWNDHYWVPDSSQLRVRELAIATAKRIWKEAAEATAEPKKAAALAKHAIKSQSTSSLNNMLKEARHLCAIELGKLDTHMWLFNVQNVTIELKPDGTFEARSQKQADYITKCAPVEYDPGATCRRWEKFLDEIMLGNKEHVEFLQKIVGYSLTGDVSERLFFILYGTGKNGKSTFLEVLLSLFGKDEYGVPASSLTFFRHPKSFGKTIRNDVAHLKGYRFVKTVESEDGARLDTELIKKITGGDTLRARRLYQEEFNFTPTQKIFLATNHKPKVPGADTAIWDRIALIPFNYRVPRAKRDGQLPGKLMKELPGILNWALEGYRKWRVDVEQYGSIQIPEAFVAATEAFRAERDLVQLFLYHCCVKDGDARHLKQDLYEKYRSFVGPVVALSSNKFTEAMRNRDFTDAKSTTKGDRRWYWLGLRIDEEKFKTAMKEHRPSYYEDNTEM